MNILGRYRNGNYNVLLLEDGTKIRNSGIDCLKLIPEFPESMDIKITNCCDMGCPYCHENSTSDGEHGDIMNAKFIDTLHPYTELAIGGGNPLSHPDLIPFLQKCKNLKLIPSMTVNQAHFMKNFDQLKQMCEDRLVYGLGVSLVDPTEEFIEKVSQLPNAVIHVIAGATPIDHVKALGNRNLKILLLGYKEFRRGEAYYAVHQDQVAAGIKAYKENLAEFLKMFEVISFDNLAIQQLDAWSMFYETWEQFYMGDDGQFTMYVDLVKQKFAVSSTSTERYPMEDDIRTMFNKIRK